MNQKKIGQFIAENRKKQKMTQAELATKLGVSDRSVSKWETGRCMPDLSLFEPLCAQLDITINELLSGEKIKTEEYQNELEKISSIRSIIHRSRSKMKNGNDPMSL